MGVPLLWKELAPVSKVRSLTELAVVEGFEANPNGTRGFRIGIDASIWFFHAAYGKEGENPELRTLFFRCANLMRAPFLPLFVFDGKFRPNEKRGKMIKKAPSKLVPGMKQIVESFGFEWREAPGEAEAELAYLNRIGVLDGILSDDVDNFLFGATTVIRNPSNNLSGNRTNPALSSDGRDDKNHTHVYRMEDIAAHPDVSLTRGDLIFIALCSGGDYDTSGMTGCGPNIAKGLVRYGFGRSLYEAAKNLPRAALPAFLHNWRNEIRHELRTDSKGHIGSKRRALAANLPDAFPDIDILLSYVNPITSETMGRGRSNLQLTWAKEPDLGKLAWTCELYFEWGYRDSIIKRFKTVVWHGAVLRILRRGVLDLTEKRRRLGFVPSTPTKNGRLEAEGTPSKLIAKHFSSLTIDSAEDEDDDDDRLIIKITRSRQHAFTDGILEYRLEIRPRQLVKIAESGLRNIRRPLDADPWAGMTESGGEAEDGEKDEELTEKEREAMEQKSVLVWMPASMVRMAEPRLVEEFEQREEAKRLAKAKTAAKKRDKDAGAMASEELSDASSPKAKAKAPPKKTTRKAKPKAVPEEEGESEPVAPKKTKAKTKPKAPLPLYSDVSSDDELPTFESSTKAHQVAGGSKSLAPAETADPFAVDPPARVVRDLTKNKGKASVAGSQVSRTKAVDPVGMDPRARVVRDLTKNKGKAAAASQTTLGNFFPLARAMARKNTAQAVSAPLASPAKHAISGASRDYTLSAPTPARQTAEGISGPSRANPVYLEEEGSEDDVRRPETPSKTRGTKEAASTPSRIAPQPFPLSFEDRPLARRRKPSSNSDSDSSSRSPPLTKSPRKSQAHTSPRDRDRSSAVRAPSPTPTLYRPAQTQTRNNLSVIDISSDSDSPPPILKLKPKPRRPTQTVARAVLQPTNFSHEVIELSD
ncbi:hypothetical protein DFH08DRAFT_922005 [Mycena albidolilacea]|uniref:XPG-I domain-containing protein n=1 Tax=Mycena albidolilacea TaxID=1033008 RepID=A0AAD7AEG4_9AGAR|nr:hypothetical protein DFH08DRAFT_922005 [Mycena albidolilacea]